MPSLLQSLLRRPSQSYGSPSQPPFSPSAHSPGLQPAQDLYLGPASSSNSAVQTYATGSRGTYTSRSYGSASGGSIYEALPTSRYYATLATQEPEHGWNDGDGVLSDDSEGGGASARSQDGSTSNGRGSVTGKSKGKDKGKARDCVGSLNSVPDREVHASLRQGGDGGGSGMVPRSPGGETYARTRWLDPAYAAPDTLLPLAGPTSHSAVGSFSSPYSNPRPHPSSSSSRSRDPSPPASFLSFGSRRSAGSNKKGGRLFKLSKWKSWDDKLSQRYSSSASASAPVALDDWRRTQTGSLYGGLDQEKLEDAAVLGRVAQAVVGSPPLPLLRLSTIPSAAPEDRNAMKNDAGADNRSILKGPSRSSKRSGSGLGSRSRLRSQPLRSGSPSQGSAVDAPGVSRVPTLASAPTRQSQVQGLTQSAAVPEVCIDADGNFVMVQPPGPKPPYQEPPYQEPRGVRKKSSQVRKNGRDQEEKVRAKGDKKAKAKRGGKRDEVGLHAPAPAGRWDGSEGEIKARDQAQGEKGGKQCRVSFGDEAAPSPLPASSLPTAIPPLPPSSSSSPSATQSSTALSPSPQSLSPAIAPSLTSSTPPNQQTTYQIVHPSLLAAVAAQLAPLASQGGTSGGGRNSNGVPSGKTNEVVDAKGVTTVKDRGKTKTAEEVLRALSRAGLLERVLEVVGEEAENGVEAGGEEELEDKSDYRYTNDLGKGIGEAQVVEQKPEASAPSPESINRAESEPIIAQEAQLGGNLAQANSGASAEPGPSPRVNLPSSPAAETPAPLPSAAVGSASPPVPRLDAQVLLTRSRPSSSVILRLISLELLAPSSLKGCVAVSNVTYEKKVWIRWTRDGWKGFQEEEAKWCEGLEGGRRDAFGFEFEAGPVDADGGGASGKVRVELAVRMEARGFQVWDNNGGKNYVAELGPVTYPTHAPTNQLSTPILASPALSGDRPTDAVAPELESAEQNSLIMSEHPVALQESSELVTSPIRTSDPHSPIAAEAISRPETPSTEPTTSTESEVSRSRFDKGNGGAPTVYASSLERIPGAGQAAMVKAVPKLMLRRTESDRAEGGEVDVIIASDTPAKPRLRPSDDKPPTATLMSAPPTKSTNPGLLGRPSPPGAKKPSGKASAGKSLSAAKLREAEAAQIDGTTFEVIASTSSMELRKRQKKRVSVKKDPTDLSSGASSIRSSRPASLHSSELSRSSSSAAAAVPGWEKRAKTLGHGTRALSPASLAPVYAASPRKMSRSHSVTVPMNHQGPKAPAKRSSVVDRARLGEIINASRPTSVASSSALSTSSSRSSYGAFGTFTTLPARGRAPTKRSSVAIPAQWVEEQRGSVVTASPELPSHSPAVASVAGHGETLESIGKGDSEGEADDDDGKRPELPAELPLPVPRGIMMRSADDRRSVASATASPPAPGSLLSEQSRLTSTESFYSAAQTPSRVLSVRSNGTSLASGSISGFTSFTVPSGAYRPAKDPSRVNYIGAEHLNHQQVTMHSLALRNGTVDSEESRRNAMRPLAPHDAKRVDISEQLVFSNLSPTPQKLQTDEVLVEIHAVGIDFWDLAIAANMARRPDAYGYIPGRSFCGRIIETGYQVSKVRRGNFVYGLQDLKKSSALAEQMIVSKDLIAVAPTGLSVEQTAALPLAGVPAYEVMSSLCEQLPRGSKVLVLNAHEGVGAIVCQLSLCLRTSRDIWVTAQCPYKIPEGDSLCRSFGAADVIRDDPLTAINSIHESSFDVVVDTIGGRRIYDASRRILHHDGAFVTTVGDELALPTVGSQWKTSIRSLRRSFFKKDRKNISYWAVSSEDNRENCGEALRELGKLASEGRIRPVVKRILPFEGASAAFRGSENEEGAGGMVVRVAADLGADESSEFAHR